MANKIMIFWCVVCLGATYQMRDAWRDIEDGDVLAWSVHITGQDTADMNNFDEFKSVAAIPGNSNKANGDTRYDDEVWVVVNRTIDGNDYTFIEQFQPLDWGDDADYCWFVDCGFTGNSNAVAETPAVPPAAERDEAYVISNQNAVVWLDSDWNVLDYEDLGTGTACDTVDVTADGIVVAGYGTAADNGPCITRWTTDLTASTIFFAPDAGWGLGEGVGTLRFTDDDEFLYAVSSVQFYKFNASTGAEVWHFNPAGSHARGYLYVDSQDNFYFNKSYATASKTQRYDEDHNLLGEVTTYGLTSDIEVDLTNTRIYVCGVSNQVGYALGEGTSSYYQLVARDFDDDNWNYAYIGDKSISYRIWNILKQGNYIYAAGTRSQSGVGGAWASVYKYDTSLTLQASYDTGRDSFEVWFDHDGNLAVASGYYPGGDNGAGVWLLDTNLNYIADYRVNLDNLNGNEAVNVPYLDAGTPAVPGHDPNYFPYNLYANLDVCVYADGIPIGTRTVTADANGTLLLDVNDTYDVVIAGINYYSIYESFPINLSYGAGWTSGFYSAIRDVKIDFYESMGCHVGVDIDNSVDWTFSYDDFATSIEPVTEIKLAPFVWGRSREPVIYLWEWDPIPMTVRNIRPKMEVFME